MDNTTRRFSSKTERPGRTRDRSRIVLMMLRSCDKRETDARSIENAFSLKVAAINRPKWPLNDSPETNRTRCYFEVNSATYQRVVRANLRNAGWLLGDCTERNRTVLAVYGGIWAEYKTQTPFDHS